MDSEGTGRITRHRFVIVGGIVLCVLVFVAAIVLLASGFRDWRRVKASVSWPTTQAEVIDSKLVRRISPPGRYSTLWERYTLEIELRYTVNGRDYTSEARLPAVAPSTPGADPSSDLATFTAPGRKFTIRYDPEDPATIMVLRGGAKSARLAMGTGALLALVSFASILLLRSQLARPQVGGGGKAQDAAASD